MKKTQRFLSLLLCAALLIVTFAACSTENNANDDKPQEGNNSDAAATITEKEGGIIEGEAATEQVDKLITTFAATNLDASPFIPSSGGAQVTPLLWASLIYRNTFGPALEDCELWIAKSITKIDEVTYDIEIYDYIKDSKGNHITADDVIFSYEMSRTLAQFVAVGPDMDSLTKTGDFSLRMKLNKNAPGTIENLLGNFRLFICDQEWYENASEEERRIDPATTGGYTVKSFVPGSSLVLQAVENYWQSDDLLPSPTLRTVKEIEFRVITEPSVRAIAVENREVDISAINATDLHRFFKDGAPIDGYNVVIGPGTASVFAFCNMDPGMSVLADNVELRRAVLYAISPEDMMYATGNTDYTGTVLKALGLTTESGYLEEWNNQDYFNYNPEKAREHFKLAGYEPGEVTVRLLANNTSFNDSVRSVIIANLEQAGFKVDILAVDSALFNTYKTDSSQWDIMLDSKSSQTGNIVGLFDYLFNPAGYSSGNVCFATDDELVALLKEATSNTNDETKRAFHKYIYDNAIVKGLYSNGFIVVSQDGIKEITTTYTTYLCPALVFKNDYNSVG